jgi:SAM-dependent methyltransferase
MTTLREAYDTSARAWGAGPDLVFGALAAALLARGPDWRGLTVVDIGAGSGTATRRLAAAGARAVPVDAAVGMLGLARRTCPCAPVAGDALALPLLADSADAAVLGFVLNHLSRPVEALREAARVVRPGGWVLATTWDRRDTHPVRDLVLDALRDRGWRMPEWYRVLKEGTAPLSDSAEALELLARDAGLAEATATEVEVPVAATPDDLVQWRLGMPHTAPFVAQLSGVERTRLCQELHDAAALAPPLVCTIVVLVSRVA